MAQTKVTTPDGRTILVTHPDGATQEEIKARVMQQAPQADHRRAGAEMAAEGMGMGEKFLVGLGRGAMDLGQGIKQKALMAGEAMGLADEGSADSYTRQVNDEVARFEQGMPGIGAESVGRFAGWMAPAALTGGVGGLGTAAAMGAAEGAIMPTEEADWGDVGVNAALGAGSAIVPGAPRAIRGALARRTLGRVDPDIEALSRRGVRASPDVYAPSATNKLAAHIADVPGFNQFRGNRMARDTERVMRELVEENPASMGMQDAFRLGKEGMERKNSEMWRDVMGKVGDAPVPNAMLGRDMQSLHKELTDLKRFEEADFVEKLWGRRTGNTVSDLHELRKKLGEMANWGDEGVSSMTRDRLYKIITDQMEGSLERAYGQEGLDLFRGAAQNTKDMYRTMNSTRVMKSAMKDKIDSESSFINAALSNDKDRRAAMKAIIGQEGAPVVRNQITNDILQTYLEQGPRAGQRKIRALDGAIGDFFGPDEAATIRGLGKFIEAAPNNNIAKILGSGSVTAASLGLPAAAGAGVPAMVAFGGLTAAMRRRDVQRQLQKLSTLDAKSKSYDDIMRRLTNTFSMGAAGAAGGQQ
jgi:hypothetical protein